MFCIKCGTNLPADAKFCANCGNPTIETPAQSEPNTMPNTQPEPEAQPAMQGEFSPEAEPASFAPEWQAPMYEAPQSYAPDIMSGVAGKAKKGISKGLLWGIIGGIVALLVILSVIFLPALFESDEDAINACLDGFEEAYNEGDMEKAFDEYCTTKLSSAASIGIGISDALMSDALGFDIGSGDLLGLGAGLSEQDMMDIADRKIEMEEGADTATVKAVFRMNFSFMGETLSQEQPVTFQMRKVDGEWLIDGMI